MNVLFAVPQRKCRRGELALPGGRHRLLLAVGLLAASASASLLPFGRREGSVAPLGEPTRSPTQAAPQLPLTPAGPQPQLFIAVYSAANGAKYAAKRAANRAECAAHYREHGVPYRFFVGEPLADSRDWDEPSEAEAPARCTSRPRYACVQSRHQARRASKSIRRRVAQSSPA